MLKNVFEAKNILLGWHKIQKTIKAIVQSVHPLCDYLETNPV